MSILQWRRNRQVKAGTGITATNAGNNQTIAIDGATQANQEAETAKKVVTSDIQHFGPSAAKCWAYVTVATGTPTLQTSYNITSITDSGVGLLTVTIATDFSSVNWPHSLSVETGSNPSIRAQSKAAGSILLVCRTVGAVDLDPDAWNFIGLGDQ